MNKREQCCGVKGIVHRLLFTNHHFHFCLLRQHSSQILASVLIKTADIRSILKARIGIGKRRTDKGAVGQDRISARKELHPLCRKQCGGMLPLVKSMDAAHDVPYDGFTIYLTSPSKLLQNVDTGAEPGTQSPTLI